MTTYGLAPVVMATLERSDAAVKLGEAVGAEVVFDPGGKTRSALRGHRAALAHALDAYVGTTHVLVLQEDAIPCPGLVDAVMRAVEARPQALLSLYIGNGHAGQSVYLRRLRACQRFANLPLNYFVPTVGIVWPVSQARGFHRWSANTGVIWDDEAIMAWRQQGHRQRADVDALATIPSLVDHDNQLPSIIGHHLHGYRDAICPWHSWQGLGEWGVGWQ